MTVKEKKKKDITAPHSTVRCAYTIYLRLKCKSESKRE